MSTPISHHEWTLSPKDHSWWRTPPNATVTATAGARWNNYNINMLRDPPCEDLRRHGMDLLDLPDKVQEDYDANAEMQAATVLASLQLLRSHHHDQQQQQHAPISIPTLPSPCLTSTTTTSSLGSNKPWLRERLQPRHDPDITNISSSTFLVSWSNSTTSTASRGSKANGSIKPCDSSISSSHSHCSDTGDHHQATILQSRHQKSNKGMAASSASTTPSTATTTWYSGTTSLAMDEDDDILSPLHCFMRKYCVEAFSATKQDITTPRYGKAHGGRIVVGQVGIRCLHCQQQPNKAERSVCYPSSLRNIYHSIETWQRRHSWICPHIPKWIRQEMIKLMTCSRSGAGGRRQYWEDSARKLGMVNTDHGVRFCRPPGVLLDDNDDDEEEERGGTVEQRDASSSSGGSEWISSSLGSMSSSRSYSRRSSSIGSNNTSSSCPIVLPQEKHLVTEYLFALMTQMETCYFSEEDRIGGRSKVKTCRIGFPGMQCKHCMGKAGFGRYFPASLQALALANSDRNIHNHLIKCRKCPQEIRDQLDELSRHHGSNSNNNNTMIVFKNKRGSRKTFFEQIWKRMHNPHNIKNNNDKCMNGNDDDRDQQQRET